MTRWMLCAAWTLSSSRPPRPTPRPKHCCAASKCLSRIDGCGAPIPMAKKSSIEKNNRRAQLAKRYNPRRERLKAIARDRNAAPEERFEAQLKLTELQRHNSQP